MLQSATLFHYTTLFRSVYGSIFRFEGQASVFWAARGACYRCLYPEPPPPGLVPSCAEGGVLGVLPGIVGISEEHTSELQSPDHLVCRILREKQNVIECA